MIRSKKRGEDERDFTAKDSCKNPEYGGRRALGTSELLRDSQCGSTAESTEGVV